MKTLLMPLLFAVLAMSGCRKDETLSGYGAADKTWILAELDGKPFVARATLSFPKEGSFAGEAPCNRYFGNQTAPYPWFKTGPIGATRMACPEIAAEQAYLGALAEMTLSEVREGVLLLSNDVGREMLFRVAKPGG